MSKLQTDHEVVPAEYIVGFTVDDSVCPENSSMKSPRMIKAFKYRVPVVVVLEFKVLTLIGYTRRRLQLTSALFILCSIFSTSMYW